jgi:phytanoyl-CoA hydroxylase
MSVAVQPDRLDDAQVQQFHRDGFLNAGMVLSDEEVGELSEALAAVIERGPDGFSESEPRPVLYRDMGAGYDADGKTISRNPNYQIVNIWECSPPFERLIRHPFIVRAIHQLTGFGDLQVWHDQVQYKPAQTGGATAWHQDAPLWPSIEPMTPVSAWIPMDTADVENGCMWMVPGSHRWENQIEFLGTAAHLKTRDEFSNLPAFNPPADVPIQSVSTRPCPVRRGEVHFHHSLTWHGSPFNQSDRPRQAVAIHYMTSEAVFTGRDHVMREFISLDPGQPMSETGPHFPVVCRRGEPVAA